VEGSGDVGDLWQGGGGGAVSAAAARPRSEDWTGGHLGTLDPSQPPLEF